MTAEIQFTYAIPCSRCGKPVEPTWEDLGDGYRKPTYEGMRFAAFFDPPLRFDLQISREDPETQERMREGHPLCDDCMEDLMDWLEGETE